MNRLLQEIADFEVDTGYEDLPAPVVEETKYLLLDPIGCALASTSTDRGKMTIALARMLGPLSEMVGIMTAE